MLKKTTNQKETVSGINISGDKTGSYKFFRLPSRFFRWLLLSSLTRRIVFLNLAGLAVLVSGILYLNTFREGLIDARVESLRTQAEIIAGAIAAQATVETGAITVDPEKLLELEADETAPFIDNSLSNLETPIVPERVAPVLKRLISPTKTRARIFDRDGIILLDSRNIYSSGQVLRFELPSLQPAERSLFEAASNWVNSFLNLSDLPAYDDGPELDERTFNEVSRALVGSNSISLKQNSQGGLVVSVAVPIQRFRAVLGVLLLSTQGGDIDEIVRGERLAIIRVFLVAAAVTIILSVLLAGTIANPLRRLSAAALRVRKSVKTRTQIPDMSDRGDEVGELSLSVREMTSSLYARIDAIESFAADVSHELKNPLTSLRSAVETLPLAEKPELKARLMEVIQHDVKRMDRLITDISDASRLDAELARSDAEPIDLKKFMEQFVSISRSAKKHSKPMNITLEYSTIDPKKTDQAYFIMGHESRLGQVFTNILENARSFVPAKGGDLQILLERSAAQVHITFQDNGPGIQAEDVNRIFDRFYTDRPNVNEFGQNSGLGLSISKQIVEAHGGDLKAENVLDDQGEIIGARFIVIFPAMDTV